MFFIKYISIAAVSFCFILLLIPCFTCFLSLSCGLHGRDTRKKGKKEVQGMNLVFICPEVEGGDSINKRP